MYLAIIKNEKIPEKWTIKGTSKSLEVMFWGIKQVQGCYT